MGNQRQWTVAYHLKRDPQQGTNNLNAQLRVKGLHNL
jgi:hypothetical protein